MYKKVKISHGDGGWGGPLIITPTEKCHTVLSVRDHGCSSRLRRNSKMRRLS